MIDTHILVWALSDIDRLSPRARELLEDPETEVLVSAASAYEIELKRPRDDSLRRIPDALESTVVKTGFIWLPIAPAHMIAAARLPMHHRDPWDRILVAQAMLEDAILISTDGWISAYDVRVLR